MVVVVVLLLLTVTVTAAIDAGIRRHIRRSIAQVLVSSQRRSAVADMQWCHGTTKAVACCQWHLGTYGWGRRAFSQRRG